MGAEQERERERIHVDGSPTHCPFCKGELEDLKSIVACAACGARHHEGCHKTHGRCATCGSVELLVPRAPRQRSRGDPLPGSKIKVERRDGATVYSWKKRAPLDLFFGAVFVVLCITSPIALWIFYKYLEDEDARIEIRPDEVVLPCATVNGLFAQTIRARRGDVGRIATQQIQQWTMLSIDVGIERYFLRPGILFAPLKPPELEWLADQLNAWKESG